LRYERLAPDGRDDQRMLLRPLFVLAFLLDDQLAEETFRHVATLIVTSASSRTSLAIAYLAARRGVRVTGLTSARNVSFVEGLRVYDDVLPYAAAGTLERSDSALIDVAGALAVRRAVHERLGDRLRRSVLVGATHTSRRPLRSLESHDRPPGPEPAFFFAPTRLHQRVRDWGRHSYQQRLRAAWDEYLTWCDGWLRIERRGPEAALDAWREVVDGTASPATGLVLSLRTEVSPAPGSSAH
jgi:hypothetical protein